MKRYLTAGTPIINDVSYADGRRIIGRLGGSVFYGLYALAMCSESPIYADTVGSDFGCGFCHGRYGIDED